MDNETKEYIDKSVKEVVETFRPIQMRITAIDFAIKSSHMVSSDDEMINCADKIYKYITNGKENTNG